MRASVRTGVGSRNRWDCLAHWSSAQHWAITPSPSPPAAKSVRTSAAADAGSTPRSLLVSFSLTKIIPPHRLNPKPHSAQAEHARRVCSRLCSVSVGLEQQACLEDSACSFQPNPHRQSRTPVAATQQPEHGGKGQTGQNIPPGFDSLCRYLSHVWSPRRPISSAVTDFGSCHSSPRAPHADTDRIGRNR
jgi:hypothetical protein